VVLQEENCHQNSIYHIAFLAAGLLLLLCLFWSYLSGDQIWAVTDPDKQCNSICNFYGRLACEIPGSV